jgi:tetratricopeptide (TPR) repeat protein/2-polyprenyl-3-methyl-5-hydroxy-6-metoxy-1,4-benzoquinol methylase
MEFTIEQMLQRAVEDHKAGKLQDAEAFYRAILQTQPKHPDANHNLGVLAVSLNKSELALPLFKTALEANSKQVQFWISYLDALIKTNQLEIAKSVLEQGKKLGLVGERVDALNAQLTHIAVEKSDSILQKKTSSFTQQHKTVSAKKKNLSSNQTNPNQARSPSQVDVNALIEHYQKRRYDLAENLAKSITQKYTDHQFSWKVLGAVFQQTGRLQESLIANQTAVALSPNDPAAHCNLGLTMQELGRLEDAETSYKKAIAIKPDLAEAHCNLGITLKKLGRLEDAEASYSKTIAIKPEYAEAHCNLGNTLKDLGRLEDAGASYSKAIAINPGYAEAHSNFGVTLHELGRLEDAETSYKKAIAIKPDYAEAHYNLGITLKELGRLEDAGASYNKAIAIKPDLTEAHINLGITLKELGRLEDAEASYRKAIAIKPDYAEAHSNLGNTLQELGRLEDAFNSVIKSIRIKPNVVAKNLLITISKKLNVEAWDLSTSQLVITALIEPWGRPSDVMPFAMRLLRKNKEFEKILDQSNHDTKEAQLDENLLNSISEKEFDATTLVQAMLTSTPIPDRELEAFFATLRTHLLKVASSLLMKEGDADNVASLYCSIAQQCFINEYVYFQTTDEIYSSQILRDQLKKALKEDQSIPSAWVIAVACYFPLYSIAGAKKLLLKNYSSDIYGVLVQQIQEPLEELEIRKSILSLTSIENHTSLKVQSQYEENPYPRWTRLPKDSSKKYLNSYIQSKFPCAGFQPMGEDRNLEILIAGCGTGQISIGTSQLFKGAKILAVDLSMASLSYAKRKTAELDIDSIEYAQADILKLNSLGRTFDVIESSGVLHHLENPFEGWKVLLSLLRPHGLMKLGFYSELARRNIVRVRNLISSKGIGSSSQDIRNYRKHLLGSKNSENYRVATNNTDFFSISTCRDLLFHVQEQHMNLSNLDRFFQDNDLTFLGFEIDSSVIQAYKKRFLNDISATNLQQWHIYEEENPDTFIGMYQFYVQRKH